MTTHVLTSGAATTDAREHDTPEHDTPEHDTTRRHILRLVVEEGPVSVMQLAKELSLTAAGVRRHVAALEDAGEITVHAGPAPGQARRGRPARRYVATPRGQSALTSAYSDLASHALEFLASLGGEDAVREFAEQRVADLAERHGSAVTSAGPDVVDRVAALAVGLSADGYAASARHLPGGRAIQLCQGHCPVQAVAARFPQLCEAEAEVFSRLLGVHVQRLSTLAAGGHVCTTHVPRASTTPASPTVTRESAPEPARAPERRTPAVTMEGRP